MNHKPLPPNHQLQNLNQKFPLLDSQPLSPNHRLQPIYHKLFTTYGQRGWWPITLHGEKIPKYHLPITHPLHRFEIAVGAILTQNTAWTNVEKALVALHENKLLTPQKISSTPHKKLAQIIRSAGYFNQKAERLKILAHFFLANDITKLPLPVLRTKLLALNGIGPETADSIILYAAEQPIFVIDAYTRRIFSRLGYLSEDESYDTWQHFFHTNLFSTLHKSLPMNKLPTSIPRTQNLPTTNSQLQTSNQSDVYRPTTNEYRLQTPDHRPQTTDLRLQTTYVFKEYHALLVEHAKQHCKKKPLCNQCPLEKGCKKKRI